MLEDSISRSRAVAPGSLIDSWKYLSAAPSTFLIIVESLDAASCPATLVLTNFMSGVAEQAALTFHNGDSYPSGPHHVLVIADCQGLELRALPAEDPSQVSCAISYTVKWL